MTAAETRRKNRTVCLPFRPELYDKTVNDPGLFRDFIDEMTVSAPELFPPEISDGYLMKDSYHSVKRNLLIRRIRLKKTGISYTIRPSFVMPYMTGKTDTVECTLFLRKFAVPYWALARISGKDHMFWYRMEHALGRNSIVGTTVRKPEKLPKHLAADEKHTRQNGKKVYIAVLTGDECVLGASVAPDAGEDSLTDAYGIFRDEARNVCPDYSPQTINTDGRAATRKALGGLFPLTVLILCFLHVYIGIRDRIKKKYKDIYHAVSDKIWNCYHADTKASFVQRVRRLREWAEKQEACPSFIRDKISKIRKNIAFFKCAYDHPEAHRTGNMIDRLMQRMDRHLFSTQYFHGTMTAAELGIRSWAIINNFAPSNPMTVQKHDGFQSPAERLNQFRYHDNWLQNLLISASLGGFRGPPQNPL